MKYLSLLIAPIVLIASAAGCSGKPVAHRAKAHTPAHTRHASQSQTSDSADAFANLRSVATGSKLTFADPKTGEVLWTADVNYSEAQSATVSSDAVATFHGVRGILYENGKQANRFTAPLVTADNTHHTVTATGGVHVVSLTQAATSARCDRMVWYRAQDKLIGTGHVVFKQAGFTETGPSFAADTRMKNIRMPAPGLGRSAGKPIHTHIAQ